MPKDILLCTLNARFHHSSFGLRYLLANMKEYREQTEILEFTINQNTRDIVESILRRAPKIVGFGVYIWNTRPTLEVISILKKIRPEILIVLGGPEVSFETETQAICQLADYTIKGESEFLFYQFCKDYLENSVLPRQKWVSGPLPEIKQIATPYSYYTDEDIKNRILYVEASRGCPYKCEYCLSSLDKSVRNFELESFLSEMDTLIKRGARQFKFVDRTFNLSISISTRILQFFLDRISLGLFLHFEMVPDRLPSELKTLISQFPPGSLQFEVGIQTWNPAIAKLVSRNQDYKKIVDNFSFLTRDSQVHLHADLIVGLPGESQESFAKGFDAVYELGSEEIQVGILKRLKGTPIIRHDLEWEMKYQDFAPFQVIQTKTMGFQVLQEMGRFAQFWDAIANSGNFKETLRYLKEISDSRDEPSIFWEFFRLSQFLSDRHPQGNGIALLNLLESVWIYFTEELMQDRDRVRETLLKDYSGKIKRDVPSFLKSSTLENSSPGTSLRTRGRTQGRTNITEALNSVPRRQSRHLSAH